VHQQPNSLPLSRIPTRYGRIELIAAGSTASIFHAHDLVLDRTVILLVVSPIKALIPSFVARFERESRLLASIDHPNIVRVLTFGNDAGVLTLATEDTDGEELERQLRHTGPLPPRDAAAIARQILSGLSALHGAGLLHLHLTPRRIVVEPSGAARLASHGLGVLRDEQDEIVRFGTLESIRYLAPEQLQHGDVSEATDLYAIAVILFEMITGETPFPGEHPAQVRAAQLQTPPPAPGGQTIAYVPPALDTIVLRALAKNPAERYGSAREMIDALNSVRWPEHAQQRASAPAPRETPAAAPLHGYDTWPSETESNGTQFGEFVPASARLIHTHAAKQERAGWLGPLLIATVAVALLVTVVWMTVGGGAGPSRGGVVAGVSLDPEQTLTPTPRVVRSIEREPEATATPKKKSKRTPTPTATAESD
jgi:serine/threonine-protein kinase